MSEWERHGHGDVAVAVLRLSGLLWTEPSASLEFSVLTCRATVSSRWPVFSNFKACGLIRTC